MSTNTPTDPAVSGQGRSRPSTRRGGRNYLIGVRGKFVLPLLLLVVLSMWLLGLALMQLTKSALAAQIAARAKIIAFSVESVIEVSQSHLEETGLPWSPRRLMSLLQSLVKEPNLESVSIYDSRGHRVAFGSGTVEDNADNQPEEAMKYLQFSFPLSFGPGEPGSIEILFSHQSLQRQLAFSLVRIIVQLAIMTVVLIVVINILTTIIVLAPIRKLLLATERIAAGDLLHRVDVSRRDEFGDLSRSFNNMQRRLRNSEEKIRHQLDSLQKAHDDLQSKESQLVQSEKMAVVGRVAAGVAHEVGNPLGSVTGYLAMLRDDNVPPQEQEEYLARTEQELGRINRIMLDLLNYARPPRLEWSRLNVSTLLLHVRNFLSAQPEFGQITFRTDIEEDLPPVCGDLHRLQQMFVNIILNASQAMPEGGIITLRGFADSRTGFAGVSVTDQGPGISEDDLPHIFEPFFTARQRGRGSGLGLALCQQIAEAVGAIIEVDSKPGEGATFTVLFPKAGDSTEEHDKDG